MASQRDRGAGNDDRCADIAPHGVKRDSNLLRHERPGNLIFGVVSALGRKLGSSLESGTRRCTPGRAGTIAGPRADTTSGPPFFWKPSLRGGESAQHKETLTRQTIRLRYCPKSAVCFRHKGNLEGAALHRFPGFFAPGAFASAFSA